jgi:hypothetical protein
MHCRSLIAVALGMLPIMFAQPIARGSTYSIAVIDKSRPSIYWELNETNGTAKDLVGDPREGANDGTYENVAFGASGPRPSDGLAKMASGNSASSVNRVGAIRHARLSTVARVPNDNYSVQCWFKSTAPFGSNVVHTIIGRGNGPTQARDTVGVGGAGLTQQGRLYFYEPVSNQIVSGLRAVYSNTWYHLVFLRSGRNVKVYLNGRLEIDTNVAAWGGGSGEHLTIGNRTDYVPLGYAFGMQGSVDEVAVWGRPLAATEVTGLYEAAGPSPLAPPPTLFADATVPHEAFLVQEGQASAAIVVGEEGSPFYHWVAEEVQRYLRHLTGAERVLV